MKTPRIANAVGYIDDELIKAAAENKRKKKSSWMKWGSLAACFALVVVAVAIAIPKMKDENHGVTIEDHIRPYKNVTVQEEAAYYEWSWEYKTVEEKYTSIDIDGKIFSGRQKEMDCDLVGEMVGVYEATGYDTYSEEYHNQKFDVYEIKGVSSDVFVAVLMDDKYYVFSSNNLEPPATFGEVLDRFGFANVIELDYLSFEEDGKEVRYFNMSDDEYVWEQLANCRNAAYVKDDKWRENKRDCISFSITSEEFGVYKRAMYITEDGYLWTNVFDYAYLYDIGEDTAANIINYVLEKAKPADSLPYMYSLAGKITEVGDGYILLDDSAMCVDPNDGIVYKIVTTAPKLSRIFDTEQVVVGDTVQVQYTDFVNLEPNAVIDSAITISEATIIDGTANIPE